jgi:hypothetical protein
MVKRSEKVIFSKESEIIRVIQCCEEETQYMCMFLFTCQAKCNIITKKSA